MCGFQFKPSFIYKFVDAARLHTRFSFLYHRHTSFSACSIAVRIRTTSASTHGATDVHHASDPQPPHSIQLHIVSAMCFCGSNNIRASQWRQASQLDPCSQYRMCSARADSKSPSRDQTSNLSHTLQLLQEGFTDKQAARITLYLSSRGRSYDIISVRRWLDILRRSHVKQPTDATAKCPIVLEHRADNLEIKAAAVVQWMSRRGLTDAELGEVLSQWPALLNITTSTLEAVTAWLRWKFNWTDASICRLLARCPQFFSRTTANLSSKLAWFIAEGCNNERMSIAVSHTPSLFNYTIARNQSQLATLQTKGLTRAEVTEMLIKRPQLMTQDMSSSITQAKFRFLDQVMRMDVQVLVKCPVFFFYSLFKRIGPRWSFHSLYCTGQHFNLSSNLAPKDEDWLHRLSSSFLDAKCVSHSMTRMQLYQEQTIEWQQGEGKKWKFEKGKCF